MVAMSGRIMPAPLAMPVIEQEAPPKEIWRVTRLGTVSVVIIARAQYGQPSGDSDEIRAGMAASILATSKGRPITPVDATNTESSEIFSAAAAVFAMSAASVIPCSPVQQLAHPLFATMAWQIPDLIRSRVILTGAAWT